MATDTGAVHRSGWPQVAAYAVVSSANQMLWLTFAPVTTAAAHHYGVSVATVGWLAAIFPLLYVPLALPAGVLLDQRFRAWLSAGAVLTAVGAVLRVGGGFDRVLVGQLVVALAQPLILNSVTKLATEYLPTRQRATGIALGSASVLFGILLSFVLGAVFDRPDQIGTLVAVSAAYAAAGGVLLPLALRRPGRGGHVAVAAAWPTLRALWDDRVIRALAALLFAGVGVFDALSTWLEALLEPAGVSESTAGVLLVELVVAGMIGAATLPPVAAARRAEPRLLGVAVLATAACCVLLAAVPGVTTAAAAMLVMGVLLLTCLPVVLELAEQRAGDAGASVAALLWMAGNAGGLVMTLLVQALVDTPALAFAALAVTLVAAAPLTRRVAFTSPAATPAHR